MKGIKNLASIEQLKGRKNNLSISMAMPELKCCSIRCHIPGLGLRKGSSSFLSALPDLLPTPQAI